MARQSFSDRMGITTPPSLGRDEISSDLVARLWNVFQPILFARRDDHSTEWRPGMVRVFHHLAWQINGLTHTASIEIRRLQRWFFGEGDDAELEWFEVYNFIEFLVADLWSYDQKIQTFAIARFNEVLEREGSRFRFVDTVLTEITDSAEVQEVDQALASGDRFSGAREHIASALENLGRRPEPDYRNAIKEAISAVESTLKVLTGRDHGDLSVALKAFQQAKPIHGALFKGLGSLYGYTSDEHGLRHALLEADANVGFAEAKFMIVACAAFMNFLILKSGER
jgi:hypothetical protein